MFALRLYIKAAEQAKTVVSYGGKTQTTYTDEFGRISEVITKKDSTELMRQVYAYKSRTVDGETLTSDQISSIVTTIGSTTTTESYSYDANGNIRTISKNGVKVYEYIYNSLNELTCEYDYTNGKKIQYSYDALGNIRAAVTYNVTFGTNGTETAEYSNLVTYGYDDTNWADKATSFKGDSITYDASGNPTLLDGYTLSWKNGRQLASASKDGMTSSYSYDSSGIRTSKLVSDSVNYSNERKDYTTIDGRITSETVSGGGMGIESYDYTVYYVYNESCEVIGFKYKYLDYANYPNWVTENYSYVKNLQGDIVGIINDATGEQVVSYTYDAWGNITSTTGTLASTIGQYNSMRYRGYYYDTETGMYYLQSRYYNPEMRRFINADEPTLINELSSKQLIGANIYCYCNNEPVVYIDPDGYDAIFNKYLNQKYKDKVTISILVRQPVKNSRVVANPKKIADVGHSFIAISYGNGTIVYKGFYPSKSVGVTQVLLKKSVSGYFIDENSSKWTVAKVFTTTKEIADKICDNIKSYKNKYNVVSNNCTTLAVSFLNTASVNHPIKKHYWSFPYNLKAIMWATCLALSLNPATFLSAKHIIAIGLTGYLYSYYGYTPADAAEDIRKCGSYVSYVNDNKLYIYSNKTQTTFWGW